MKTFLRWCAALVLGLVVLVATLYLAHGLHGVAELSVAKQQAADDLAAALPDSRQQAVRDRDRVRAAVGARWGRPAYSWQELVCELESRDAGFIVQSYGQYCRLETVDLIPLARTRGDGCLTTSLPGALPETDPGEGPTSWVDAARGPSSTFGEDLLRSGCPNGIVESRGLGVSRMLAGSRPDSLDGSPAWIAVTVRTEVSNTDLGCDPWALPFCSGPVEEPVLGDLGQDALRGS